MNSSTFAHTPVGLEMSRHPHMHTLYLAAGAPVHSLHCPSLSLGEIHVRQGRVWLTQEGLPEDLFLAAGDSWPVAGAAVLHLSAEGDGPAWLELTVQPG